MNGGSEKSIASSMVFVEAANPQGVNRRSKLTPYRRPKLTPLRYGTIRFGWIGCVTAGQAASESALGSVVASERLAEIRAESDQSGVNRALMLKIELVGSPLVSFLRVAAISAPPYSNVFYQPASKFGFCSASNFDPLERRVRAVALAPSELVGVAETARARVVG